MFSHLILRPPAAAVKDDAIDVIWCFIFRGWFQLVFTLQNPAKRARVESDASRGSAARGRGKTRGTVRALGPGSSALKAIALDSDD